MMPDLPWHDETEFSDGCVVTVQHASFDGDVGGGSPLVEVGRTTTNREGDGFVPGGRGVGLFGTGIEHTAVQYR